MNYPVGVGRDIRFVRDHDDCYAGFVKLGQHVHNLVGLCGGEIAGRLVRENYFGAVYQGSGDGHTLLLPAGELVGVVMQPVAKSHLAQTFFGYDFAVAGAGINQRQRHVVRGAHAREQIELLKNKSYGL